MELLRDLDKIGKDDVTLAGGKGASLGEMIRAGFPVPEGFVILTSAFEIFLEEADLGQQIEVILNNIKHEQISTVEVASEKIQELILCAKIPQVIVDEIQKFFKNLGVEYVAVRSSATAEDSRSAAWAGQLETYLNTTEATLLENIKKCWASLFTLRAFSYRFEKNLRKQKISIAIVVQRMVDASFAGVMFTANPITGDRKEVIIDGNPGLGESVVSGLSTPDHFVLSKGWRMWRITSRQKGKREVVIKLKLGGGTERVKGLYGEELPDEVLLKLTKYGLALQRHFGCPQDIEWAWTGQIIYIVQARPMTALLGEIPKLGWIGRAVASTLAEFIPSRPYPLDMSLIASIIDCCRPHFKFFGVSLPRTERLWDIEEGIPIRLIPGAVIKPSLSLIATPFRVAYNAIRYSATTWRTDPIFKKMLATLIDIETQDFSTFSIQEVLQRERSIWGLFTQAIHLPIRYLPSALWSCVSVKLILLFLGRSKSFSKLVFSGLNTKVTETNRALEDLAMHIRSTPVLAEIFQRNEAKHLQQEIKQTKDGQEFLKLFYAFLYTYGYRESAGTILVSSPSWKESPDIVLSLLQGLASTEYLMKPPSLSWTSVRDEMLEKPLMQLPFARSFFIRSLQVARCTQEIKEDVRFYIMVLLYLLRKVFREIGKRMSASGVIDLSDDVYWLTWSELSETIKHVSSPLASTHTFQMLIAKRKSKFNEIANTPFIDSRLFHARIDIDGACLTGMSGSPGIAEGPARIITNIEQFNRLRLGEVLVAPYTNPAWTPLFQRAAAVVVDTGSILSHAAIVAREYGIPAVMATSEGTRFLKDGDWVRVDGTIGCVYLVR